MDLDFRLSKVECQSGRLGEDVWYVNEEKQDQMNLSQAPYLC